LSNIGFINILYYYSEFIKLVNDYFAIMINNVSTYIYNQL